MVSRHVAAIINSYTTHYYRFLLSQNSINGHQIRRINLNRIINLVIMHDYLPKEQIKNSSISASY